MMSFSPPSTSPLKRPFEDVWGSTTVQENPFKRTRVSSPSSFSNPNAPPSPSPSPSSPSPFSSPSPSFSRSHFTTPSNNGPFSQSLFSSPTAPATSTLKRQRAPETPSTSLASPSRPTKRTRVFTDPFQAHESEPLPIVGGGGGVGEPRDLRFVLVEDGLAVNPSNLRDRPAPSPSLSLSPPTPYSTLHPSKDTTITDIPASELSPATSSDNSSPSTSSLALVPSNNFNNMDMGTLLRLNYPRVPRPFYPGGSLGTSGGKLATISHPSPRRSSSSPPLLTYSGPIVEEVDDEEDFGLEVVHSSDYPLVESLSESDGGDGGDAMEID